MLDTTPAQNNSAPPGATLSCAACGSNNTPDSRFCRHCGIALGAVNTNGATAPAMANATATNELSAAPNGSVENGHHAPTLAPAATSIAAASVALDSNSPQVGNRVADEIDHRRAQQLLDRAFMLAERGDKAAAIIACRQAVSLDHNSASGYSILGLLLEQTGDIPHAIQAYEKVLEISPDSLLERESLQRLKAMLGQSNSANIFHFNAEELYEDTPSSDAQPTGAVLPPTAANAPVTAPAVAAVAGMAVAGATLAGATASPAMANPAVAANPALAGSPTSSTGQGVGAPSAASRPPTLTSAPAGSRAALPTGLLSQPLPAAPSPVRPVDFGMPFATQSDPWWRAMQRQPSFYFRGFPLTAATALSLLFLLWARNWAVSREQSSQVTAATATTTQGNAPLGSGVATRSARSANPGNPANPATGTANNGGFSVTGGELSGKSAAPAPPIAPASSGQAAGGTTTQRSGGNRLPASAAGGAVPRFPGVAPRLAPAVPVPARNDNKNNDDNFSGMPQPRMEMPDRGANTAVKVLPADRSGTTDVGPSSTGGAPLNPGGAGRGYVRVSPYRVAPASVPPRSSARAAAAEAQANQAIRSGHPERAADIITPSMESGDVAYNYQSRALLFMERGDYGRARDDFQTAISYYRDQIRRGDNSNAARKGLQSCEDGRRDALARLGG